MLLLALAASRAAGDPLADPDHIDDNMLSLSGDTTTSWAWDVEGDSDVDVAGDRDKGRGSGAFTTALSRVSVPRVPAGAPALREVVDAALRAAGLAQDPVPGWRARSRWSALVPAITSRLGNSQSWREVTDPTVSRALSYDVRVSWRLERLIYDPNEPRFTMLDLRLRRERRQLTAHATHAYFLWARALARVATSVDTDATDRDTGDRDRSDRDREGPPALSRALIQARSAQAELDILTDGWFSEALANLARSR